MEPNKRVKLYDHLYEWNSTKSEVATYSKMITKAVDDKLMEIKEISGQDFTPTICIDTGMLVYFWAPTKDAHPTVRSEKGYTYRIDNNFVQVHVYEQLAHWQQLANNLADFAYRSDAVVELLYEYLKLDDTDANNTQSE